MRCDDDLHLSRGRVAQGELRAELVAHAHERRQARDELQVLRTAYRSTSRAELSRTDSRDCHDTKARERVVERYIDRCVAVGVKGHAGIPQQEGIEEFAGRAQT